MLGCLVNLVHGLDLDVNSPGMFSFPPPKPAGCHGTKSSIANRFPKEDGEYHRPRNG